MKLPEKLGMAGTGVSLLGIAFGWGIFPWLLKKEIGKIKALAPGSESRGFWEKVPFAIGFKVYFFNVTNYMDVQQKGEIPILSEVGPYHYHEWKDKTEIVDFEEDDSVTFYMRNTWIYNKEKTAPLTGNEMVIIPHPILVGLITAVERDKAGVLGMVNKALPILFDKPDSIFIKSTVYDLLYGGIIFNCSTKDFAASAVCAVLKKETPGLENISPTISKFSFFKTRNGSNDPLKFQVYRGIVDYRKVGELIKINGKKKLTMWRGKPCNDLVGTDATVFPPIEKPENDILMFSVELCRSLSAKYVGPSRYKHIPTIRYNISLGDMSTEAALKCFCTNDTMCWKKGVMDLMKCTGNPIIGSMPHFHDSHEDYLNGVRGLNPNENDHGIYLELEPMTGTPMLAKKRIQFSFPIHKISKIDITQNLPSVLLPFIWVEENIELPDEMIAKIDAELFQVLRIVDVVKWVITILGAAIMSGGVGLYYKRQNSLAISPTSGTSRKLGSSTDFLADKKTQNTELGHTNYGYM